MSRSPVSVVTGGLSYIGKSITKRLVEAGHEVLILTGHPDRPNPFGKQVRVLPFRFAYPALLTESLRGATTLYNTYWVRFDYREVSFERAIENTRVLFQAAGQAGIQKVVHLSVSNPSEDSPFPYYRGKATVEKSLLESTLPYVIIRPTLVFGGEDEILISNITWLLRRFPIFALPRGAAYRLQPIHVDEVAALAVEAAASAHNAILDAAGPEIHRFEDMVRLIRDKIRSRALFIRTRPAVALLLLKVVGLMVRDVVLTKDELGALGADLLVSHETPRGKTNLGNWLDRNGPHLGRRYASEITRHFR